MALIRPDFWLPPLPDFILGLVDHTWKNQFTTFAPVSPLDYIFPILIVTGAFGVQCCLLVHLLRKGRWRLWRRGRNKGSRTPSCSSYESARNSNAFFFAANVGLGLLFTLGGLLFLANTAFRIWAFRYVRSASSFIVKAHPTVCSTTWCLEVPEPTGKLNQGLELALAAVMQALILFADFLLVVRCYIVFSDKIWVWALAAFPLAISIGSTIAGVVVIITSRNSFDQGAVYYSFHFHLGDALSSSAHISPFVSTASSVLVNVVVTAAIVGRVLGARRRMVRLTKDKGPEASRGVEQQDTRRSSVRSSISSTIRRTLRSAPRYHTTTSALLIESALPSALCGVLACVIQPDFIRTERMAVVINARYTLRMLWVTFTVAAPQMILLRVMMRRDAHTLSQVWEKEKEGWTTVDGMRFSDTDSASVGGGVDGGSGAGDG